MNKKVLLSILLGILIVPSVALGAATTIKEIVDNAKTSLVPIVASLSVIAFIIAGVMFLSATGNPSRMTVAKGALIAAVLGIVILALAGSADTFVKTFFGM